MDLNKQKIPGQSWGFTATLAVAIIGYVNSLFISTVLLFSAISLFGKGITENISFNLLLLALSDLAFLLVIVIFLVTKGNKLTDAFRSELPKYKKLWLQMIPAFLGYIILTTAALLVVSWLLPSLDLGQSQDIAFKSADGVFEIIISAIALLVVAPIAEELIFRGFIFRGFRNSFGILTAAIISSLIFGVVHGQLNVAIDTFCLGLMLCYLYQKTDSIWPSIALHSLKNSIAFALIFFVNL